MISASSAMVYHIFSRRINLCTKVARTFLQICWKIQFSTITSAATFNEHLKWPTMREHVINMHQSSTCSGNHDLITLRVSRTKRLTNESSFLQRPRGSQDLQN